MKMILETDILTVEVGQSVNWSVKTEEDVMKKQKR